MTAAVRPLMRFAGTTPRSGSAVHECDDRFAARGRRFAVADGVSESGYSGVWARILTDAFCSAHAAGLELEALGTWLAASRSEWRHWADEESRRDLPWFAREALRAGAFATFVGLTFPSESGAAAWQAVACGDACLFVVRDDRLEETFPVTGGDAFDNTPRLVRTSPRPGGDALRTATGAARIGDAFYLATDALAHWFLTGHDRGEKPWNALDGVNTSSDLEILVSASRGSHTLRNDDVTLVSIVVAADE